MKMSNMEIRTRGNGLVLEWDLYAHKMYIERNCNAKEYFDRHDYIPEPVLSPTIGGYHLEVEYNFVKHMKKKLKDCSKLWLPNSNTVFTRNHEGKLFAYFDRENVYEKYAQLPTVVHYYLRGHDIKTILDKDTLSHKPVKKELKKILEKGYLVEIDDFRNLEDVNANFEAARNVDIHIDCITGNPIDHGFIITRPIIETDRYFNFYFEVPEDKTCESSDIIDNLFSPRLSDFDQIDILRRVLHSDFSKVTLRTIDDNYGVLEYTDVKTLKPCKAFLTRFKSFSKRKYEIGL